VFCGRAGSSDATNRDDDNSDIGGEREHPERVFGDVD
jgi:hypothetical protein